MVDEGAEAVVAAGMILLYRKGPTEYFPNSEKRDNFPNTGVLGKPVSDSRWWWCSGIDQFRDVRMASLD